MFKKSLMALSLVAASGIAMAEDVNYGDPTASYTSLGVSRSENATQVNGIAGFGKHNFMVDVTRTDRKVRDGDNGYNFRGRYFYITNGLGGSVDVLADEHSRTVLGGGMYKMQVTDNFMVFPMVSVGRFEMKNNKAMDTNLGQVGLYAMYAFDQGHWLYVNPKKTYLQEQKTSVDQVEIGGGLMVRNNVSVGFKVEHTGKNAKLGLEKDTVTSLQANYYF